MGGVKLYVWVEFEVTHKDREWGCISAITDSVDEAIQLAKRNMLPGEKARITIKDKLIDKYARDVIWVEK